MVQFWISPLAASIVLSFRMDHCVFLFNQGHQKCWVRYIFHSSISIRDINCFVGKYRKYVCDEDFTSFNLTRYVVSLCLELSTVYYFISNPDGRDLHKHQYGEMQPLRYFTHSD